MASNSDRLRSPSMNPSTWRGHTQESLAALKAQQEAERSLLSSGRGPDRPTAYSSQASVSDPARQPSGNQIVHKTYSPPAPQRIIDPRQGQPVRSQPGDLRQGQPVRSQPGDPQQGQPLRSMPGAGPAPTQLSGDRKLTTDLDAGLMSVLNDIKKELNDAKKLSSLSKSIDGNSSSSAASSARTEANPSVATRAAAPQLVREPYASQPNPYLRSAPVRTYQSDPSRPPQHHQPSAPRPAASDATWSQASTNRPSMASSEENQDFATSLQKLRARLADVNNAPPSQNASSHQTPRTNANLFSSSPSLPTGERASATNDQSAGPSEGGGGSPPLAPGLVKTKVPPGWEMKLDSASGKIFYVNHTLKAISWERPTENWGAANRLASAAPALGLRGELPTASSQQPGQNSARRQDPRQSRASPPAEHHPPGPRDAGTGGGAWRSEVMLDEFGRQHRYERGGTATAAGGGGPGQSSDERTRAVAPGAPRLSAAPGTGAQQRGEGARLYASAGGGAGLGGMGGVGAGGQGGGERPGRMTESQFLQLAEAAGERAGGQPVRALGSTFDAASSSSALRQSSSNLDRGREREQRPAPSSSQLLRTSLDPARFAKLEREMQIEAQQAEMRARQRAGGGHTGGHDVKDPTLQLLLTAVDRLQRHLNAGEPLPARWQETAEEAAKAQQHPRMAEYEFEAWCRSIRNIPRDEEDEDPQPEPERHVPWQAKSSSAAMAHAAPQAPAAQSWQV